MNNGQSTSTEDPPVAEEGEKTTASAPSNSVSSRPSPSGNSRITDKVDKIRDLIFGEEMVSYEARFNALESRLVAEVDSLRKSVEARLAELKDVTEKRSSEVENLSVSRRKLGDALQKLAENIRD